ncbi:MAG: hypothetical protein ACOX3R_05025 [Desulfitobacteriia bacterium]
MSKKTKRIVLSVPALYLIFYLAGFLFLMANNGMDYHVINSKYNNITLRYLLGFPSCIISATALLLNAWLIEKTKSIKISKRYQKLALIFIIYGFLEGLLVSKADYFPANIINKELFIRYFEFTDEVQLSSQK